MDINSMKRAQASKPDTPKAEVVMKICLMVSVVLGAVLFVLSLIAQRNILDVGGTVIIMVVLQWLFYMVAKAKGRSGQD